MYFFRKKFRCGFSLTEAVVAVIILGMTTSGVLTIIDRSITSAGDSARQIRAFEVARENMETLLGLDSVKEQVEYGITDDGIEWQNTIEAFSESTTALMWVQAVCTANYEDSSGQIQTVELTNWLTSLSEKQTQEILESKYLKTIEEAALYAGVSEETIEQWVDNGMPLTDEGYFIRIQLDLYKQTNGAPTLQQINEAEEDSLVPESPESEETPAESPVELPDDIPEDLKKLLESILGK